MPQFMNFERLQFAVTAGRQVAQLQRAKRHTLQIEDFVPDSCHQSANFTIFAFLKFQFQNRALAFTLVNMDAAKLEIPFGKVHSVAQLIQSVRLRNAGHMAAVTADHFKTRVSQLLSQVAVVRNQQHSFGVFVQTAHREHPLFADRHKVHSSRAPHRIVVGTQHALGLVHKEIAETWHPQTFGIQTNVLSPWINAASRISHNFGIHRDSSGANVFFAIAA